MYNYFIERVKQNLHVVLAMSPIGDAFRNRLRMFPSLINCCTIDWFKVCLCFCLSVCLLFSVSLYLCVFVVLRSGSIEQNVKLKHHSMLQKHLTYWQKFNKVLSFTCDCLGCDVRKWNTEPWTSNGYICWTISVVLMKSARYVTLIYRKAPFKKCHVFFTKFDSLLFSVTNCHTLTNPPMKNLSQATIPPPHLYASYCMLHRNYQASRELFIYP